MIEVGEYIRTKKDGICKLLNIENDYMWCGYVDKPFWLRKDNIVKHSKNLIDLIKEGDYVNGEKIGQIENGFLWYGWSTEIDDYSTFFKEKDIETVVTKEQIKQIEFIVKE